MTANNYDPLQRQVYFKAYTELNLLENAIELFKEQRFVGPQISILGKVDQFYNDKGMEMSKDFDCLKRYWKDTFVKTAPFGSLYNPEIGNIFFVGAITSIFLNKVDGKTLGMLSVGPYGILRGIGATENQSKHYLKTLENGSYLLIVRGYEEELKNCERLLDDTVTL